DLAAMDPHLAAPEAAFPFRIVALPSRELHRRLPEIAQADDVVIIDAPQLEDHAGIARSALRYADEILIPCAPSPIEINRTTPVRDEIAEIASVRAAAARRAAPDAGPAGRTAIRSKPVRITLDLSPELYRQLTAWADSAAVTLDVPRVSLADAVRAMIRVAADNPDDVLDRLRHDRD